MSARKPPRALVAAKADFLAQWAALGPAWGVNRTMSQIHALLMVASAPLNTDQIMAELAISRGNAHANLKELSSWGLLRSLKQPGDRKEYFEAEKDVWRVVQIIARERKRKELQPVLGALASGLERTKGLKDAESRAFRKQLRELQRFAGMADSVLERVSSRRSGAILPWILRFLK